MTNFKINFIKYVDSFCSLERFPVSFFVRWFLFMHLIFSNLTWCCEVDWRSGEFHVMEGIHRMTEYTTDSTTNTKSRINTSTFNRFRIVGRYTKKSTKHSHKRKAKTRWSIIFITHIGDAWLQLISKITGHRQTLQIIRFRSYQYQIFTCVWSDFKGLYHLSQRFHGQN